MKNIVVAAAFMAAILSLGAARAGVLSVVKNVDTGTFTLLNSDPSIGVTELLVEEIGYGGSNATSAPGFTAAQVLFGADPLGCQADTRSTISVGFCYKDTNPAQGGPITAASTTFTFDPAGDDASVSSQFALLFTSAAGVGGCTGNTGVGGGCTVGVDEPASATMLLTVLGLLALTGVPARLRGSGRGAMRLLGLAMLAALAVKPADARTTQIIVDTTTPVSIGGVAYSQMYGRIFGELDPADIHNTGIQDIQLAPLDSNQKVPYAATITILTPLAGANGMMLYQVSNRGSQVQPNASTVSPGATYVWTGWQGDLLAKPCITDYPCLNLASGPYLGSSGTHVIQVPVARNGDASTITGPVYGYMLNQSGSTGQLIPYLSPVPYRPATLDTSQAVLTSATHQSITGEETGRTVIASTDWAWADCRSVAFPGTPDPTRLCLLNGIDPNLIYQMTFTGRDPLVVAVGFAATRDAVSFLRDAAADDTGAANPLAGRITKTIAMGTSQSGNFLRSLIYYGFNQDEANHQVFDGLWPHIAGRQIWMNTRFALPDVIQALYMAGDEAPVWWADVADPARGRAPDGLLHSCTATATCPKVIETYGGNEWWDLKMSPDRIGTTGAADLPNPANVYTYYFPSTQHYGGLASAFSAAGTLNLPATVFPVTTPAVPAGCALPANPNPETDQFNAVLDIVVAWVVNGTPPPASAYPTLAQGQLVLPTQAAMQFPNIPGFPLPPNLVNPLLGYDFGPLFDTPHQTGIITIQPPTITAVYPTAVVKTNTDGNEVAGVPSVNLQVPLGTYTGWNTWASGGRAGEICNLSGSYNAFAVTRAARLASSDPRPSLEERYGSHDGFVCAVKLAARSALDRRFLRQDAATALVAAAQGSAVLAGLLTPTPADMAHVYFYCNAAASTGL